MGENNVNVKSWMDLFTDPGFAVLVGMVCLLGGLALVAFCPVNNTTMAEAAFVIFGPSVVGVITAHAWKDADKTKFLLGAKSAPVVPADPVAVDPQVKS